MKKYMCIILVAVFLGIAVTIIYSSKDTNSDMLVNATVNEVYFFQMAAFENYDNALDFKDDTSYQVVYDDIDNVYYIYSGIYSNVDLVNRLKNHYEENDVNYVIKEEIVDSEFYEELLEYERLLLQTTDVDVLLRTNQIIVNNFVLTN